MNIEYVSATDTAKAIRTALKAAFPGATFSVRTDKYSGGASVRVAWVDGPTVAEVDPVVKPFAGGTFDGQTDSYTYTTGMRGGQPVNWGVNYVFTNRTISAEHAAELRAAATAILGHDLPTQPAELIDCAFRLDLDYIEWLTDEHSLIRALAEQPGAVL